ncbi:PilW family protein [Thiocystis violacea]|uniref:PilW family protein n=1 Tax=Thiocystis violacea TaxID=13725 RepID=UPI001903240B|nr:PilW family protein [Thiocystis violacea]MBK1723741.1 hypothetical protein [Thiocystis violacea]
MRTKNLNLCRFVSITPRRGFTLVELLVAMTVGLFLTTGILSLFIGSKQSYTNNEAMGAVQENGRYVLEQMGQELRQAGLLGCQRTLMLQKTLPEVGSSGRLMQGFSDDTYKIYNALALVDPVDTNPNTDTEAVDWWLYNLNSQAPIEGFDGTGSGFVASEPPDFISVSGLFEELGIDNAISDHDVVVSRRVIGRPIPIIQNDIPTGTPPVAQPLVVLSASAADIKAGDIVVASTCEHATVFQITKIQVNTPCDGFDTVEFKPLPASDSDYAPPGNQDYAATADPTANVSLGSRYANDIDMGAACGMANKNDLVIDTIGALYRLQVNFYYVKNNDDGIPSLYRKSNLGDEQELVTGVYGLQFLYGTNTLASSCGGTNSPDLSGYTPANQVVNWNEVNAVKISLLLGSTDEGHGNIVDVPIKAPFPDTGDDGVFDASTLAAKDRHRLFQVFTSTVFLRNKLPCLGVDQWTTPTGTSP